MTDFLEIIQSLLPVPVLLAILCILGAGWIVRQARGYQSNSPLFHDRVFITTTIICLISLGLFYAYNQIEEQRPDIQFEKTEFGIYIFPFENDSNRTLTKVFSASLGAALDAPEGTKIRVFVSDKEVPKETNELQEILADTNAGLIIHGTLLPDEKHCYLVLLKRGTKHWQRLRQPVEANSPMELVKAINFDIPTRELNSIPQSVTNKISKLQETVSAIEFQIRESARRIKKLENVLSSANLANALNDEGSDITPGKNIAVSIGINDYKARQYALRYAVADAQAMDLVLKDLGYSKRYLLIDEQASKQNIEEIIVDKLRKESSPIDNIVLYYAGHGISETFGNGNSMGFLCPYNFEPKKTYSTCISMTQIRDWFKLIPARKITLFIDACVAGFAGETGVRGVKAVIKDDFDLTPSKPVLYTTRDDGERVIIAAGTSTQVAYEKANLGHGLFTYHVLKGLMGNGDLNSDGIIAANELFSYVYPKVAKASNGSQTPQMFAWGSDSIRLVKVGNVTSVELPNDSDITTVTR